MTTDQRPRPLDSAPANRRSLNLRPLSTGGRVRKHRIWVRWFNTELAHLAVFSDTDTQARTRCGRRLYLSEMSRALRGQPRCQACATPRPYRRGRFDLTDTEEL